MKALVVALAILFASAQAFATDRVLEVQSRVTSALNGVLPKTDYLVIVNRLDALDSVGSGTVAGMIKSLPGLRVGVDEEGQVVLKDGEVSAFNGPVSVTVVIDSEVKAETYRAIEALMPEIMGGSRGGDEVKLRRAVLRQVTEKDEPQVVINNLPSQVDPNAGKASSDLLKISALFFVGLGLLLWLMSRKQNTGKDVERPKRPQSEPRFDREKPEHELRSKSGWDPKNFEQFDPGVLGLYVLKCLHEKDIARARSFFSEATPLAQKNALSSLPAWLSVHCVEQVEPKEGDIALKEVNPEAMLREVTVMERALKDDPSARATALIQWIPAEAMNKVHPESLAAPTDETRYAVIALRPDLARAFMYDENDALVSGMIFNAKAMLAAAAEMSAWKTRLVIAKSAKTSVVEAMAGIVNRTETFEEVDKKLSGIKKKVSKLDWEALQPRIVSRETFERLTDFQKKDFLRAVNPTDWFYITNALSVGSDWSLDTLLRPKRLAAFRASERMNDHEAWSSDDKREANARVLNQLRAIYLGEQSVAAPMAAAA